MSEKNAEWQMKYGGAHLWIIWGRFSVMPFFLEQKIGSSRTVTIDPGGCNKAYLTLVPFVAVVQQHTKTGGDTFIMVGGLN